MTSNELQPTEVRLSVLSALLSNVTPQFRRVTFEVHDETIGLQFLFEPPDDTELRELAEEIGTLVVADFVHSQIAVEVEFSDRTIPASALPDHVFLRRERGMFSDSPEPKIMFGIGGRTQ